METEIYKIPIGRYVRGCIMRRLSRWWWIAAVPLVGLAIAGLYDWRWWVVALAVVCVAMPGVTMMAFYHYALSADGVRAIMPQRAVLCDRGLMLEYFPMDYADAQPKGRAPQPRLIRHGDVVACYEMGAYTTIELRGGETIEIPVSAQPPGMNFNKIFNHLV